MSSYRDPFGEAATELAARQQRVAASLAALRPAARAVLEDRHRDVLDHATSALTARPRDLDGVARVNRQLDAVEALLAPPPSADVGAPIQTVGRRIDPASRREELRALFREYNDAVTADQQRPYGVPCSADDLEPQINAIGRDDLPLLDELVASGDQRVVPWARGRAKEIRASND